MFNLIKEPTCFKSVSNPSCIDLILTNQKFSFKNTSILETGISDFHRMVLTITKSTFEKGKPTIISYRSYKHFDAFYFKAEYVGSTTSA